MKVHAFRVQAPMLHGFWFKHLIFQKINLRGPLHHHYQNYIIRLPLPIDSYFHFSYLLVLPMDSRNLIFALLALLLAVGSMADGGSILRSENDMRSMYDAWLETNGKFDNALEEGRYEIFKDNLKFVDEHNLPENGHSFKVGLNRFADLTNEEYRKMYLGTKMNREARLGIKKGDKFLYKVGDELPDMIDWRVKGAVAAVKDQGSCGEC